MLLNNDRYRSSSDLMLGGQRHHCINHDLELSTGMTKIGLLGIASELKSVMEIELLKCFLAVPCLR